MPWSWAGRRSSSSSAQANRLWLEIRVYPTLAGISLYLRGIDERKRAEDEHRLADQRLRQKTEDLLERVRLDEVLQSVGQLIHSTLEIDEIMHRALDEMLLALHADAGTVEMREGGAWLMRYQRGGGPGEHGRRRTDAEMPIAARASLARAAVVFPDLLDDASTLAFAREHDVRSCLAVPLIIREKTVGCLAIWGRESTRLLDRGADVRAEARLVCLAGAGELPALRAGGDDGAPQRGPVVGSAVESHLPFADCIRWGCSSSRWCCRRCS